MGSLELAEATTEVLESGEQTLRELADQANREHVLVLEAVGAAIHHAILAGEALIRARERVEPRTWTQWLSDNVDVSETAVRRYIRFATYKDVVLAQGLTTIASASKYLRGLPAAGDDHGATRALPESVRAEAQRLHEAGATYWEIAGLLGCAPSTARRMIDPEFLARHREANNRRRVERRNQHVQRLEQKRERAIKKIGGAVAESYSLLRKTAQALDRAEREAETREVRAAVKAALSKVYNAEDEIVRALGVS